MKKGYLGLSWEIREGFQEEVNIRDPKDEVHMDQRSAAARVLSGGPGLCKRVRWGERGAA